MTVTIKLFLSYLIFLRSPESTSQTASRSVQPSFAGLTIVTDLPTDKQIMLLRLQQ